MTNETPARSPLRTLAWNYYRGEVPHREQYLEQRRELIDGITGERSKPRKIAATDLVKPGADNRKSTSTRLVVGVGIAIAVAAIVASLVSLRNADETEAVATGQPGGQQTTLPTSTLGNFGQRLVSEGWDTGAAAGFLQTWADADETERDSARQERWYAHLRDLVKDKIDESMALVGADGTIGPREQFLMSALADALAIESPAWPKTVDEDSEAVEQSAGLINRNATAPEQPSVPQELEADEAFFDEDLNPAATESEAPELSAPATPPADPEQTTAITPTPTDPPLALPEAVQSDPENPPPAAAQADQPPAPVPPALPAPAEIKPVQAQVQNSPAQTAQTAQDRGCQGDIAQTRRPFCRDYINERTRGPRMVVLGGGKYLIGGDREPEEQPRIEVNLNYRFALSTHEISFREYRLFCTDTGAACPENPWRDDNMPAVGISWNEARAYTDWLAKKTRKRYRLPSEAEWEYAARAGSTTPYPFGDSVMITQARYSAPGSPVSEPLSNAYRAINPNRFQLYHMVGNAREWVADAWQDRHDQSIKSGAARSGGGSDAARVVRGGSYADGPRAIHSSSRTQLPASQKDKFTGFRVALSFADDAS